MTEIRLDHVVIAVSDWGAANAFDGEVCGAEVVALDDQPTHWRYRFGDQVLNVHGPGMSPGPEARIRVAPGASDLCLVWPGPIETAVDHLGAHCVEVEQGPVRRNGGRGAGLSVYFRDPDGSLLEFISYEWPRVG